MQQALRQAGRAVREIRLVLCQSGRASEGAREFIKAHYEGLRQHGQDVVIRECSQAAPSLTVRLEYGVEKRLDLSGLSSADIASRVERLALDAEKINRSI